MGEIKGKILKAALKEFLKLGKSGAKTKAIAEKAGVNKAMIHYYFKNKETLFTECITTILKDMEETFHKSDVKQFKDYKSFLRALIESYSDFIDTHDKHIIFLLWENLNDSALLEQITRILGSSHLNYFIQRTEAAIAGGEIKKTDPRTFYLNLISLSLAAHLTIPITLSFMKLNTEEEKMITKKRNYEVFRLLWSDIALDAGRQGEI